MAKKIRFESDNASQKEFSNELRKTINSYFKENSISTKGDYRMWIKTFLLLGLYIAPLVVILTVTMNPWLALMLVVIMGIGEAGVGMSVMHDAAHGAYSKHKWVNDLFSGTMVLLGSNTFNWLIQHNYLHHTFTNIYGYDPDIDTKATLRLSKYAPLKKYHRFQHIYAFPLYGLMTLSKLFSDISQLLGYEKEGYLQEKKMKIRLEIFKLILLKSIYVAVIIGLPFIFTSYTWWQIVIGFVSMHIVAGAIMGTVFQMAHVVEGVKQHLPNEKGIIENDWTVHELLTASDFARNSSLLSWYVGGLNYQIEHHLFPHICHIHYPAIAPLVEQTAKKYGLSYDLKPSFFHSFTSHIRKLKELGTQYEESVYSKGKLKSNPL